MTKSDLLNKLYKDYNLTTEDVYAHKHYTIITRSGIEKVQAAEGIKVDYEVIRMEPDYAVIKATAGDVQTFGSAKYGSYKDGNTQTWYIAELAEKRALSRCVLKHTNLYQHGVFGDDEGDWEDDRKELTSQVINRANNAILRGEQTADEVIEALEDQNYIVGESHKFNWKKLKIQ